MLIFNQESLLAHWAGERLGIKSFGIFTAIGVVRHGNIVAAAIYNNYHWPNIEITFVSSTPAWASRQAICSLLWKYPFEQLECKRVGALTSVDNVKARKFLERLGFELEGYHRQALSTGDAVSYGILRADAQKWNMKNVQGR